ncbi:MAG: OmpA family protein [Bacteroidota bacterium]
MRNIIVTLIGFFIIMNDSYGQSFLEKVKNSVERNMNKGDAKTLLKETSIPFWFNSSDINYFGKANLDAVISAINSNGAEKITEIYIKSFVINEADNLERERSEAVKSYMIENGVTPDRLKILEKGDQGSGAIINDRIKEMTPDERKTIFLILF